MRRALRHLFTILSALSLLLCVAVCVLWVRSYYIAERLWMLHPDNANGSLCALSVRTAGGAITVASQRQWELVPPPRPRPFIEVTHDRNRYHADDDEDTLFHRTPGRKWGRGPIAFTGVVYARDPTPQEVLDVRADVAGFKQMDRQVVAEMSIHPQSRRNDLVRSAIQRRQTLSALRLRGWEARLTIPAWSLVGLTLALPAMCYRRYRIRRRRRLDGLCAACGYDLRASPERCPECGTANPRAV